MVIICLMSLAIITFCCFYLLSDYKSLVIWFLKMNDCFYSSKHWQDNFFSPGVKKQGNIYCIAGLIVCLLLLYLLSKQWKRAAETLKFRFAKQNLWYVSLCMLLSTAAWIWGNSLVHQSFDEVFSAINCASLPPFQTLSYYMLPNNHILFNLLNSTLFIFADDKVFTGKLISLACYLGTVLVMFSFWTGFVKNKLLLTVITVVLALQFPVWGFGYEARGYALYTFMAWLSFYSLVQYIHTNHQQWLYYYAVAVVAGYWCLPTFLYFHSAILIFGLLWTVYTCAWDVCFWKMQLIIVSAVFLLYLPAICFSGIHALSGNPYVSGHIMTWKEFYISTRVSFNNYLSFFSSSFTKHHSGDVALFLLPLSLLCFYRNRMAVLCGLFYVALWSSCIGVAFAMKIYAIDRTLSGHISISFGLTIYSFYLILQKLNSVVKSPLFTDTVLMILLILQGIRFGIGDKMNADFALYNNDINIKYDLIVHEGIDIISKGSTIAFSDECFYWYYQCERRGFIVNKHISGNEQYFVRLKSELLPAGYAKRYRLIKTVFKHGITAVSYEIYKKI